jgi:prophage regulatory protein
MAASPQLAGAGANVAAPPAQGHRCLRMSEVCDKTGLRETALRQQVAAGTFPPPFKIGQRAIAWLADDIDRWIADRAARRLMFAIPLPKKGGAKVR